MGFSVGARLGSYEILSELGAGGMGEVYRARDTRLNRDVAIKVLPDAFACDPERLARFEREAQVLASLNHPNIAHIHGLEESHRVRALVMELVEGEDLAQRITRGAIPIEEALPIARQMAEALEAAHEQGIVHRDLKPANIKVKGDGTVKVLDFGLAKLAEPDRAGRVGGAGRDGLSQAPTITKPAGMTGAGVILGTAAYMSPEQAKGRPVDKRADIWAFGAVLFEMLSGKQAFQGESAVETLRAVVNADPVWSTLPSDTPIHIRQLLRLCLEKNPRQRLQAAGDARLLLAPPVDVPTATARSARQSGPWMAWAVAATVFAGWALGGWLRPQQSNGAAPSLTVTLAPPSDSGIVEVGGLTATPNISPDGSSVLYRSRSNLTMFRKLSSLEPQSLTATARIGNDEFWSPDSMTMAFFASNDLKKMRLPDGAAEVIAQVFGPTRGASWNENGTILFASGALFIVPHTGGTPKRIEVPGLTDGNFFYPEFLPGGEDFLVGFVARGSEQLEIYLARLHEGSPADPLILLKSDTVPRYTPAGGGRVLFVRDDNLYAQALDVTSRTLSGEPELVQRGVASAPAFYRAHFSVSRTGVVAWRPGKAALSQVTFFDRQGRQIGTAGPPSSVAFLRLSPDETRVLAGSVSSDASWLFERGRPGRLSVGNEGWRLWSPDGLRLLGGRQSRLIERDAVGSAEARESMDVPGLGRVEDISPDARHLLFLNPDGIFSIGLNGPSQERVPTAVVKTGEEVYVPRFSPDGRWIVYMARTANGPIGIYVQSFPAQGLRKQIADSGRFPVWRKDGKEIVYYDPDRIWSVRVERTGADLRFSAPEPLFPVRRPVGFINGLNPLAVSGDGTHVYFPQAAEQRDSDVIHVKTGWLGTP